MPRTTCSVIAARQTDLGVGYVTLKRNIPTRRAVRASWQRGGGYDPTFNDACDLIGLEYVGVALVEYIAGHYSRTIATAGNFPLWSAA